MNRNTMGNRGTGHSAFSNPWPALLFGCLWVGLGHAAPVTVGDVPSLRAAAEDLRPGTTILLKDGTYRDLALILKGSGTQEEPIVVRAENPGKVFFSGDVQVEIRGAHITLSGIYFKDGNRKGNRWKTHGPGLVAIYGDHHRVTSCVFHDFDDVPSAWITTSLDETGRVPTHCRIDHCTFTEKLTRDQVINLNNTAAKSLTGDSGAPMCHTIDHCLFSNPPKKGNGGGGIRIGYWRKDMGRCLVVSNLFLRQDSEGEIVTSKSTENVYLANTIQDCAGTLNFRHGDRQVALHNFFLGGDGLKQAGGMFIWGSGHQVGGNYFSLKNPLQERGGAAISLNPGVPGSEHALAFDITIARNTFVAMGGYAIHFEALLDRRLASGNSLGGAVEVPRQIRVVQNMFFQPKASPHPLFYPLESTGPERGTFEDNRVDGSELGFAPSSGFTRVHMDFTRRGDLLFPTPATTPGPAVPAWSIEGIGVDVPVLMNQYIQGSPLTPREVGAPWCPDVPGTWAGTGRLTPERQARLSANDRVKE